MTLGPGDRFGSYEVIELVGIGGMGEVYRARDTRLRRDVALKLLVEARQRDPEFSRRLEREAVLLASLNHPSIATLHGIETSGDAHALVMEFVDGETLADRLAHAGRNGLRIDETLRIARQLVDALDAAHARGVVHRDLKPANIKLRSDGAVKVLDFGVAKTLQVEQQGHAGATMTATRIGAVVGTPAYMSPEQATGGRVDERTDIWAFGCVLYEMLTGRLAFDGGDASDTVARILTHTPGWDELEPNVPPSIKGLLRACLQKDPRLRLRDIADARFFIEDAAADPKAAAATKKRSGLSWARAGTALLVLVGAGIGWWIARQDAAVAVQPADNPLARAQFTRFTNFPGSERDAALSPDGKFVVFLANRDGPTDVFLSQVGTGRFENLTQGRVQTLGDLIVRNIGITHDGSDIWLAGRNPDRKMRWMPLLGGPPQDFVLGNAIAVAWSHEGERLAYHTGDTGDPMFVADRTGANARPIHVHPPPAGHNHFPIWSPDGEWIYFVSGDFDTADMDLWRISPRGEALERLTSHHNDVTHPTVLDGDTVLYLSPADDGSGPWLWAFDTKRKSTSRISYGLETFSSLAASADGRRLVATVSNPVASLWSVPILEERLAEDRDATPYLVPSVRAVGPRFGGGYLFYLSSLGSGDGLWRYDVRDGEREIWKGREGALLAPAGVSADGQRLVIALGRERIRLHVMSVDGTPLNPLDSTINVRGSASWSPDDNWIVAGGSDADGPGLFKIPVNGGAPVRLVNGPASDPVWSPSDLIVYKGPSVTLEAPLLAVRPDGTPVKLPEINLRPGGQRYRFLDGERLVYMQGQLESQNFWLLNVATGEKKPLTQLGENGEVRSFDLTPDGRQIVFDRVRDSSDIVLIDLPR